MFSMDAKRTASAISSGVRGSTDEGKDFLERLAGLRPHVLVADDEKGLHPTEFTRPDIHKVDDFRQPRIPDA